MFSLIDAILTLCRKLKLSKRETLLTIILVLATSASPVGAPVIKLITSASIITQESK